MAVRLIVCLTLAALLSGCTSSTRDASPVPARTTDTLDRHADGTPRLVVVSKGDSVVERRTYRKTGMLRKVVSGDSVRTYFDLHDPDSARVLRDYLQGRWRNLSADTSQPRASAFYIFEPNRLTFETPSRTPLESLEVTYEDDRTLTTETGMRARVVISSFDTVHVTRYTLVRSPDDSL